MTRVTLTSDCYSYLILPAFKAVVIKSSVITQQLKADLLVLAHRAQIRLCFAVGYNPEELLKRRHAGKFGLTRVFRDDRDDIDDIFGGGIFIVLNVTIVTIVTFACVTDI